jgi:hypothetical protein
LFSAKHDCLVEYLWASQPLMWSTERSSLAKFD